MEEHFHCKRNYIPLPLSLGVHREISEVYLFPMYDSALITPLLRRHTASTSREPWLQYGDGPSVVTNCLEISDPATEWWSEDGTVWQVSWTKRIPSRNPAAMLTAIRKAQHRL